MKPYKEKKSFSIPDTSPTEKPEQNILSSKKLKQIETSVDNSKNTINNGSTAEEVLRILGQPDKKVGLGWFYGDSSVTIYKGEVIGYNNNGNLITTKKGVVGITLQNSADSSQPAPSEYFIIGTASREVSRIQGQPENVVKVRGAYGDSAVTWYYRDSVVTIADGKVIGYVNKGNLKTIEKGIVGIILQKSDDSSLPASSGYFIIGSASSEVTRIQGQPSSVVKRGRVRGNPVFTWFYGDSAVTISNGIVIGYNNMGNLKTYKKGILGIVKKIR